MSKTLTLSSLLVTRLINAITWTFEGEGGRGVGVGGEGEGWLREYRMML